MGSIQVSCNHGSVHFEDVNQMGTGELIRHHVLVGCDVQCCSTIVFPHCTTE